MNLFKEYPNLFANGQFKVSIEKYTSIENDIWNFVGTYSDELMLERGEHAAFEHEQLPPVECQLLARPISDMTDEEIRKIFKLHPRVSGRRDIRSKRKALILQADIGALPLNQVRALADLGVYFGPQSDFDKGEVLNTKEVHL